MLTNLSTKNIAVGNGSVSTYSFGFKIFLATHLLVEIYDAAGDAPTVLAYGTDYTVSGAGVSTGGSITLLAGALTTGYTIVIRRNIPLTQIYNFRNQGGFQPQNAEDCADWAMMCIQQLAEVSARSMQFQDQYTGFDPTVHQVNPAGVPGSTFMVDPTGSFLTQGPSGTDITNAQANAAAAAASASAASTSATAASTSATASSASAASAAASAASAAAALYQWAGTAGGTANALTLTPTPALLAYSAGNRMEFIAASSNTGAATLNVSGLGAKTLTDQSGAALTANAIVAGSLYTASYDGTEFRVVANTGVTAAGIQSETYIYAADSGSANAYAVALTPALTAYAAGDTVVMKVANTNTGASTLNVNSLGNKNIKVYAAGAIEALPAGALQAGTVCKLVYDGTQFLLESAVPVDGVNIASIQAGSYDYAADGGSANAYTAAFTPAIAAYTAGLCLSVKIANSNTGASTINVNSLGTKNIKVYTNGSLADPPAGALPAGNIVTLQYDGTQFLLVSRAVQTFSQVTVDTPSGYGSTNTMIRRYGNTVVSIGSAITYASSATNGDSFTVNEPGIYSISHSDSATSSSGWAIGISRNSAALTTSILSQTSAATLALQGGYNSGSTTYPACSWTGVLAAGDVIRAHDSGGIGTSSGTPGRFNITKVSA